MAFPPADYASSVLPLAACKAPRSQWQEWFSWAYIQSIAAAAGVTPYVAPIDANQTDLLVQTWYPLNGQVRMIGLQLKSTHAPKFVEDGAYVVHDLEGERFNRLLESSTVPRFMVVIAVPPPEVALVTLASDTATLSAAAWWGRIEGEPTEQSYKRVRIPTAQRFDAAGLTTMLLDA